MEIVETSIFHRRVQRLLTEDEYQLFREELARRPDWGPVMRGSGGIRKVRWAAKGRGKRGGARVIYYWATAQDQILLLFIYTKNEQDDLTHEQLKTLRKIVEEQYP
jgi:hypothetical protein